MSAAELPPAEIAVPFERVGTMVRQLTHDVRNGLNALELQAAYVSDLMRDPVDFSEVQGELKRLRGQIAEQGRMLQRFAVRFRPVTPHPMPYPVKNFIEDFRAWLAKSQPDLAPLVAWTQALPDKSLSVDAEMIFAALGEFFQNAAQFQEPGGSLTADAVVAAGRFQITLCEQRSAVSSAPDTWGCEPLVSTRRGGFGLGLFHARRVLAEHGGAVKFAHDPGAAQLTTRLFLPLA